GRGPPPPALGGAVGRAVFAGLPRPPPTPRGEIMEIVAEGLQPDGEGADLPWLR
ncbi:MarR family transcriptional regulator, partial [Streptomyces sp. NPDC127064]